MKKTVNAKSMTKLVQGRTISHVVVEEKKRLSIHFSDGKTMIVEATGGEIVATIEEPQPSSQKSKQPSKRQMEYLAFIAKYIDRFGRSPAESDIQRHFLVSAPSVNQMMQTLERSGLITRQAGVPRSARICVELDAPHRPGQAT